MSNQTKIGLLKEWILVNNNVRPLDLAQDNAMHYVVLDLKPRTPYVLRITAHNSAGSTVKEYKFSTLGKFMRVKSEANLKDNFFTNFDEAAKLCTSSYDAYNHGGWLILLDVLNEKVAKK